MPEKDIFHTNTQKPKDDFFDALSQKDILAEGKGKKEFREALASLKKETQRDQIINWTTGEQQKLIREIQSKEKLTTPQYLEMLRQELQREVREKASYAGAYFGLDPIQKEVGTVDKVAQALDAVLRAKEKIINHPELVEFCQPKNGTSIFTPVLDAGGLFALMAKESQMNPRERSDTQAVGLFQIRAIAYREVKKEFPRLAADAKNYKQESVSNAIIGILFNIMMQKRAQKIFGTTIPAERQRLGNALYNMGEGNAARVHGTFNTWEEFAQHMSLKTNGKNVNNRAVDDNFNIPYRSRVQNENRLDGNITFDRGRIPRKKIVQTLRYVELIEAIRNQTEAVVAREVRGGRATPTLPPSPSPSPSPTATPTQAPLERLPETVPPKFFDILTLCRKTTSIICIIS